MDKVIVAGLILVVALVAFLLWEGVGRPVAWELPPNYKGWVVFQYEKPDCPALREHGIFLVHIVGQDARGCTSSPVPRGWRYSTYSCIQANGERLPIPSSSWSREPQIWANSYNPGRKAEVFFVGSEEELQASWDRRPKLWE